MFVQKQKQEWHKVSELPCSAKDASTVVKVIYICYGCSLWAKHHLHRANIACFIDATKLAVLLSTEHSKVPFISLFLCQQMGLQLVDLRDFSQWCVRISIHGTYGEFHNLYVEELSIAGSWRPSCCFVCS